MAMASWIAKKPKHTGEDEWDLVQTTGENNVFMPGRDDVVRYHRSGITVSRMEHAGLDLDGPRRERVGLSPELKASLASIHGKALDESDVPSSTFSSSPSSFSTTSTFSSSSSSTTLSVVDNDGKSDVCLLAPYFDTVDGPGSCPNPAFSPANTDTTTSLGADEAAHHATANTDRSGNTSDCTSTKVSGDSNNGSKVMDQVREKGQDDGRINHRGAKLDQMASTTVPAPPTPAARDVDQSTPVSQRVLKVGDTLTGSLISPTGKSAIWAAKEGSIAFGQITVDSSNASGVQKIGRVRSSILVASESGALKRVVQARAVLMKEHLEGRVPVHESGKIPWGWGWVPRRSRLQDDVERARGRVGELEMTITDRGGVEVSMDGMRVLSRSGRFTREWMNRFPRRRSKNNSYELHVKDDGMEVRLQEKRIWGITADDIAG